MLEAGRYKGRCQQSRRETDPTHKTRFMKHAKVKSQAVVFLHPQLDASIHTKVHLLHDPNISSPECLLGAPLYNCSSTQVSNQQATQEKLSGWGQDGLLKFRASEHRRKTVLKSVGRKAGWAAVCILETAVSTTVSHPTISWLHRQQYQKEKISGGRQFFGPTMSEQDGQTASS